MTNSVSSRYSHDLAQCHVNMEIKKNGNALTVRIETARLIIESVNTKQHEADLVSLYGDKEVNRLVGAGTTLEADATKAKIERWISRWNENTPFSGYVVKEKDSGKFIGQIILKPLKDRSDGTVKFVPGATEIGFLSVKECWSQGYGKEYTHAMVHHFISELIQQGYEVKGTPIAYTMATARVDNVGSNRVLASSLEHTGTSPRYGSPREWYRYNFHT